MLKSCIESEDTYERNDNLILKAYEFFDIAGVPSLYIIDNV